MGMFEFLKKKGKEDNIESIPVNDGIISLNNIEIVQNMNKM